MGKRIGAGLKGIQLLWRGLVLCCSVVVVGIYGYFLYTMHTHKLFIHRWVRAVEGIAGAGGFYSLVGVLLLWCLAGHRAASFVACVLDILFIAGFIYIAAANRGGAGRCNGGNVKTPFGTGDSSITKMANNKGSIVKLPSFHTACKMETASLAVSILAIIFLACAFFNELLIVRNHRREKAFVPPPDAENGAGAGKRRFGLFGKKKNAAVDANGNYDPNALPAHAGPDQMQEAQAAAAAHNNKYSQPNY